MATSAVLEIVAGQGSPAAAERVLTHDAIDFIAALHHEFEPRRQELLQLRAQRQARLNAGEQLDFLPDTASVRQADWRVAPAPPDLDDRRVEITGPVDRKMMINALNSGAQVFMADFEDSLSPTWTNVIEGQLNLQDAVRRTLSYRSAEGKAYELEEITATLLVRPRGWHLTEKHCLVDGQPISASLFDFGLFFFHNATELVARGSGPYFYLPKLESHLEARLWNDVFLTAQEALGLPSGTVRATVLIETILAAFEMDEILYELREHAAGLNAGRWDYIFSTIKTFAHLADFVLPDRASVTMAVPFMSAYTDLLVRTCHRRQAHAIGGMAAFIPNRRDAAVTETALARVREDKVRECRKGFDGTWVAHPDLVAVAAAVFNETLGGHPHQKQVLRADVQVGAHELLDVKSTPGQITLDGVRTNVEVALRYIAAWLAGTGAVAIHNLMEDMATAEISRAQLWQWCVHGASLADARRMSAALYQQVREHELAALQTAEPDNTAHWQQAARLLDDMVLSHEFIPFLTLSGYQQLD